jgi:hypothetical protein
VKIKDTERKRIIGAMSELKNARYPFWTLWREVADYFLPKRYVWLQSSREARTRTAKNPYILDSTGTTACRVLASGMMNGITSPSRPWFRLRVPGFDLEGDAVALWADECVRRMLYIMSESNFYNAMAVLYLDLVVFGSGAMLIYEDDDNVIRCYNPALGEFYLGQSYRLTVDTFAREFQQTVSQMVKRFGEKNVSEQVLSKHKSGGANALHSYDISHLIEPNPKNGSIPDHFEYMETYWETARNDDVVLERKGYHELPGIFPRWELTANDAYGTSPAMDALPDVIQLQQETKRKAQGLDKMVNPRPAATPADRSHAGRDHVRRWEQQYRREADVPDHGAAPRDDDGHRADTGTYPRDAPQQPLQHDLADRHRPLRDRNRRSAGGEARPARLRSRAFRERGPRPCDQSHLLDHAAEGNAPGLSRLPRSNAGSA